MKLPSAPLVEVIFEMRWALEGAESLPIQLRQDPGYPLLAPEFTERAKVNGFTFRREVDAGAPGPLGHSVHHRYYLDEESPFPIWQIGPGLFACNESTDYEWQSFKGNLRKGLNVLLASYPKSKSFPIRPVHLELRYVDGFNADLVGHTDIVKFLGRDVKIDLTPIDFLSSEEFSEGIMGRMELIKKLKNDEESLFIVEVTTASRASPPTIQVVNKVLKRSKLIDLGNTNRSVVSNAIKWADNAHRLTHEFFQDFVREELMKKFKE